MLHINSPTGQCWSRFILPLPGSTRSSGAKGPSDTEIRSRISREEEEVRFPHAGVLPPEFLTQKTCMSKEHKRRMREIYEKYGSVSAPRGSHAA